MQDS